MGKADYKKEGKTNSFICGCCYNGSKDPKCKQVKKRVRAMGKKLIQDELELDRGVTVDPREFEVTDELIEKIAKGDRDEEGTEDSVQERRKPE